MAQQQRRFDRVEVDYESVAVGQDERVGEGGSCGLRCKRRATTRHRNLIMAECVPLRRLHLRVNSANIREGGRVALRGWLGAQVWMRGGKKVRMRAVLNLFSPLTCSLLCPSDARTCGMANCQYGCEVLKGEVRCQCPSPGLQLASDGRTCVGTSHSSYICIYIYIYISLPQA